MNGARGLGFGALQKNHIGSVDPDALKIRARRAEYSLAESALSPLQAEPTHTQASDGRGVKPHPTRKIPALRRATGQRAPDALSRDDINTLLKAAPGTRGRA